MIKGLEGLDGCKSAENLTYEAGTGTFRAAFDAKKAVSWDQFKAAITYTIDWVEFHISGDVDKIDGGLRLTAMGSGAKYALRNRAKRGEEKDAPNVETQIEALLKEGEKSLVIRGRLSKEEKVGEVLSLESVGVVKKGDK